VGLVLFFFVGLWGFFFGGGGVMTGVESCRGARRAWWSIG